MGNAPTGRSASSPDAARFPEIGQWALGITRCKFGRGTVNTPDDSQIGWAAINAGSLGLQVGVQDLKMLLVIQDAAALEKFKQNDLSGSVSGSPWLGKLEGVGRHRSIAA